MRFEENFAVVEIEVLQHETIYDFIERIISERNKLLQSPFFDFENFIIIGEFNERVVLCNPKSTKEEVLSIYNDCLDFSVVREAYKILGRMADNFVKDLRENNNISINEENPTPLTIVDVCESSDTEEEFCQRLLELTQTFVDDGKIKNFVLIGNCNGLAVVCKPGVDFVNLMLQLVENKLPHKEVRNLYRICGNEVDFVIANFNILTDEEKAKAREDFASNYNNCRAIIKNRLKKREDVKAEKRAILDDYMLGTPYYLTKDTEKFPKGTKVSIKGKDMLNSVVPVLIVGVGDDLFCVSPTELSKEEPKNPIAKMIDHTLLKPNATKEQLAKLCEEAKEFGFASVCVNPCNVPFCYDILRATDVKVCTVIGFPLGANAINIKVEEAAFAVAQGATELDYVINIGMVKEHDWAYVEKEMEEFLRFQKEGILVKVILETCLLTDEEIIEVCKIAKRLDLAFVKTSTGFSTGGAEERVVKLMADTVKGTYSKTLVKASGGIRTKEDAEKMIKAGASRIGTSNGVTIVQ